MFLNETWSRCGVADRLKRVVPDHWGLIWNRSVSAGLCSERRDSELSGTGSPRKALRWLPFLCGKGIACVALKRNCVCCPEKVLLCCPEKVLHVLPWKGIACAQSRTPLMIHLYIYINKYNVVAKHDKEKGYLYVWNSMLLILLNIWTAPVCDTYIFAWGEKRMKR